jgi:hypothetical protein
MVSSSSSGLIPKSFSRNALPNFIDKTVGSNVGVFDLVNCYVSSISSLEPCSMKPFSKQSCLLTSYSAFESIFKKNYFLVKYTSLRSCSLGSGRSFLNCMNTKVYLNLHR